MAHLSTAASCLQRVQWELRCYELDNFRQSHALMGMPVDVLRFWHRLIARQLELNGGDVRATALLPLATLAVNVKAGEGE